MALCIGQWSVAFMVCGRWSVVLVGGAGRWSVVGLVGMVYGFTPRHPNYPPLNSPYITS